MARPRSRAWMYDFSALPPPCRGSFCPVKPQRIVLGITRCRSCPGQYAFDGRMMFIGNLRNLWIDTRCMSKATFEAAYGLVGLIGSAPLGAALTPPHISQGPNSVKR